MSKIAESSVYGGTIWGLAVDNDSIYIGGELTRKVYKLSKSTLNKLGESEDYGGNIFGLDVDDSFLYEIGRASCRERVYISVEAIVGTETKYTERRGRYL